MSGRSYGRPHVAIAGRTVGPGYPCYVIAEAGSNHNRDLATALRLIDVAAKAGADAVKFQTYRAEGLYSRHAPSMSYLSDGGLLDEGETVFDLIKRIEIPWEWHRVLASHSRERGIHFLSTPFEELAVEALEAVSVPAWKIASYEVNHFPLIRRCAQTRLPLLISTGMASLGDIERALDVANAAGATEILLFHCAINYPPSFEDLNLRAIPTLASAFGLPVGWSDHTTGHTADVVAVALGACAIEKHFTLDKEQAGPDHAFALEPCELTAMVRAIRETEQALGTTIKRMTASEQEMFRLGRRSLVATRLIEQGERIAATDIAVKRPGYGIAVDQLDLVIGRRASRRIEEDEPMSWQAIG